MAKPPHICTIIAKNYVAFARTLCQSFLKQHPDGKCSVLIIDDLEGLIDPSNEVFDVVVPDQLDIANLPSFCFKYDVVELATAFKPFLMEYLIFHHELDALLYLDPDIGVQNPLDGLYQLLERYDIVVTPHLDKDYDDDLFPDTGNILRHGTFNLGFVGVSSRPNALDFLKWWQNKLYNHCIIAYDGSYYVDQKFVELVPSLFCNYYIEHGPGYNTAYWNLHSRRLHQESGVWHCNDTLLFFFHFSGYNPNAPHLLTKTRNLTRYTIANRPDTEPLFMQYRNQILQNGHDISRHWRYSLGFFASGESIPEGLRVRYREEPLKWGNIPSPFTSSALIQEASQMKRQTKRQALRNRLQLRTRLRKVLGRFLL